MMRRSEIDGIRKGVETTQRLYPESQATSIEIAGGVARFTGVDSLSQAFGVGTLAPVSTGEIDRLTEFYESRNGTPRVYVTPMADPSLGRGLAAAGYAPAAYENVLASASFDAYARYDDRVAVATDLAAWTRASTQGFANSESPAPSDERLAMILASSEGVCPLEARDHDTIVSTAAMSLRGECSTCFAGSTIPRFRQHGWHLALIRDRIARARDAGARVMRATAPPGSASERNFHRCGFVTLYTRALWERKA